MSNARIDKLAEKLEAAENNPIEFQKLLSNARVCDLLVLHFLNMGYSGSDTKITNAIENALIDHFAEGEGYLIRSRN